jgi:DNA-binding transcriptional MerR regulator
MRWISSIELIEKTNISRATLNNYIRMNILPKPDVQKPSDPIVRAKRIGYFPDSVLTTLEQIKSLKKDGFTMAAIRERLNRISSATQTPAVPKRNINSQVSMFEEILPDPSVEIPISGVHEDYVMGASDYHSLCVLAADIQDAQRLRAELHPEEYFDLVRQVWGSTWSAVKSCRGLCGRHPGQGIMVFYFLKTPNSPYLMNAIHCAMTMRQGMMKVTAEWRLRKGWLNELYLNIGISEGEGYLGFMHTPTGISPATFDGVLQEAIGLAEFVRGGSIWVTKHVIQKMNRKEREKIRYGIRHPKQDREVFVRNSFARVADLPLHEPSGSRRFAEMESLAVTEMTDMI